MPYPKFPFKEIELPYQLNQLEPQLNSAMTGYHYKEIYKKNLLMLNSSVAASHALQTWSLDEIILLQMRYEPPGIQNASKFYGSSVFNHALYFYGMTTPNKTHPSGNLLIAILRQFGTFAQFKSLFLDAVTSMLGVGWIWLNSEQDGNIHIAITYNNDTPQLSAVTPILVADLWEHAYMSQFGTRAVDYVANWFNVIDWDLAEQRFNASLQRDGKPFFRVENPFPPKTPGTPATPGTHPAHGGMPVSPPSAAAPSAIIAPPSSVPQSPAAAPQPAAPEPITGPGPYLAQTMKTRNL